MLFNIEMSFSLTKSCLCHAEVRSISFLINDFMFYWDASYLSMTVLLEISLSLINCLPFTALKILKYKSSEFIQ